MVTHDTYEFGSRLEYEKEISRLLTMISDKEDDLSYQRVDLTEEYDRLIDEYIRFCALAKNG